MTAKQAAPVPLADLMPWSVPPMRLGREWVMAPDPATLAARWDRFVRTEGAEAREELFRPSRARTLRSSVAQLPGQAGSTGRLARESGPCPPPVRVLHGPYDQQWLLPDHRLIDAARPELWRVADARQIFAVEQGAPARRAAESQGHRGCQGNQGLHSPQGSQSSQGSQSPQSPQGPQSARAADPALVFSTLVPDGSGRPGRVRPLYRRPGGREPNLAPGLLELLSRRLARTVEAEDFLAWAAASAVHSPGGCAVPLCADAAVWDSGVELGRRLLWLHTRGAGTGERPRMPGGRRPYVRAAPPGRGLPDSIDHDADEETLLLGPGRISPVSSGAWDFHAGGAAVLRTWFERRTAPAEAGALAAMGPASWPREWTSDLLELITVLTLIDELRPRVEELADRVARAEPIDAARLTELGVLPVPDRTRRPASVLDHHEEGPEGQFALL